MTRRCARGPADADGRTTAPSLGRAGAVGATIAATLLAGALVPAESAAAAPRTTACATISIGSRGPAVADVQHLVGARADGDFGPRTANAVRAWQRAHHLPQSGSLDAGMWRALSPREAARACAAPVTLPPRSSRTCAMVQRGDVGAAVDALQARLRFAPDGDFGPRTQAAVLAAQQAHRLPTTGRVDAATWSALGLTGTPACRLRPPTTTTTTSTTAASSIAAQVTKAVAALAHRHDRPAPPTASTAVAFARHQLGIRYRWGGTDRRGYDCSGLVQTSYRAAGLLLDRTASQQYAEGSQVQLDDLRAGDIVFFATNLLKPATIQHDAIYAGGGRMIEAPHAGATVRLVPLRASGLLPRAARPAALLRLPAGRGATRFTARQVQARLAAVGYRVAVDGAFGPQTSAAVSAYQRRVRRPATGVVDAATWQQLASGRR